MLFYLFKAFDQIESIIHFLQVRKELFSCMRATHDLSYHLILVPYVQCSQNSVVQLLVFKLCSCTASVHITQPVLVSQYSFHFQLLAVFKNKKIFRIQNLTLYLLYSVADKVRKDIYQREYFLLLKICGTDPAAPVLDGQLFSLSYYHAWQIHLYSLQSFLFGIYRSIHQFSTVSCRQI